MYTALSRRPPTTFPLRRPAPTNSSRTAKNDKNQYSYFLTDLLEPSRGVHSNIIWRKSLQWDFLKGNQNTLTLSSRNYLQLIQVCCQLWNCYFNRISVCPYNTKDVLEIQTLRSCCWQVSVCRTKWNRIVTHLNCRINFKPVFQNCWIINKYRSFFLWN